MVSLLCLSKIKSWKRSAKHLFHLSTGPFPSRGFDYKEILNSCSLDTLECRCKMSAIKFLYKVLQNDIDAIYIIGCLCINVPRLHSRYHCTFNCPRARSNVLFNAPIYKLSQTANSLGEEVDIYVSPLKQIMQNVRDVFA